MEETQNWQWLRVAPQHLFGMNQLGYRFINPLCSVLFSKFRYGCPDYLSYRASHPDLPNQDIYRSYVETYGDTSGNWPDTKYGSVLTESSPIE